MIKQYLIYFYALFFSWLGYGQNKIDIAASVNPNDKSIKVLQTITYVNTTKDTLKTIYLNDWNHSYSSKTTPLAKRFEEEFNTKFHLAKNKQRGYTTITSLTNKNNLSLGYERLQNQQDVIKITPLKTYTTQ